MTITTAAAATTTPNERCEKNKCTMWWWKIVRKTMATISHCILAHRVEELFKLFHKTLNNVCLQWNTVWCQRRRGLFSRLFSIKSIELAPIRSYYFLLFYSFRTKNLSDFFSGRSKFSSLLCTLQIYVPPPLIYIYTILYAVRFLWTLDSFFASRKKLSRRANYFFDFVVELHLQSWQMVV